MSDVVIRTRYGEMPAYLAVPDGAGPWPGVVVVHDFGGMGRDLRSQADWLAAEGLLAAAPDLYYWGGRLRCLWTIMREVTAGTGRTVGDIDAARDWVAARDDCTGRIGIIGFCMGGGYALALAAGHGFINDHDPADMTLLLTFLSKVSGTRYHQPSAADAHRRIAAFFSRHLTA